MSLPWSSRPLKTTPINTDELLIIDFADSKNKRITLGSMPFIPTIDGPFLPLAGNTAGTPMTGDIYGGGVTSLFDIDGITIKTGAPILMDGGPIEGVGRIKFNNLPVANTIIAFGNNQSIGWRDFNDTADASIRFSDSDNFEFLYNNNMQMTINPADAEINVYGQSIKNLNAITDDDGNPIVDFSIIPNADRYISMQSGLSPNTHPRIESIGDQDTNLIISAESDGEVIFQRPINIADNTDPALLRLGRSTMSPSDPLGDIIYYGGGTDFAKIETYTAPGLPSGEAGVMEFSLWDTVSLIKYFAIDATGATSSPVQVFSNMSIDGALLIQNDTNIQQISVDYTGAVTTPQLIHEFDFLWQQNQMFSIKQFIDDDGPTTLAGRAEFSVASSGSAMPVFKLVGDPTLGPHLEMDGYLNVEDNYIQFTDINTPPTPAPASDMGVLYGKEVLTKSHLFWLNEDGIEYDLIQTAIDGPYLPLAGNTDANPITGNIFMNNGDIQGVQDLTDKLGNPILELSGSDTAANNIIILTGEAGSAPQIGPDGSDFPIDLEIFSQGTGSKITMLGPVNIADGLIISKSNFTAPSIDTGYIFYNNLTDPTPDQLEINVETGSIITLTYNAIPEYTFSETELDVHGNALQQLSQIQDEFGKTQLLFETDFNSLDGTLAYLAIRNGKDGSQPRIKTLGDGQDINLLIEPKGRGQLQLLNGATFSKRSGTFSPTDTSEAYIFYRDLGDPTPDQLEINVETGSLLALTYGGVIEYTFGETELDVHGNFVENAGAYTFQGIEQVNEPTTEQNIHYNITQSPNRFHYTVPSGAQQSFYFGGTESFTMASDAMVFNDKDIKTVGFLDFGTPAAEPAGNTYTIFKNGNGDLRINTISGKSIELRVNADVEFAVSEAQINVADKKIVGLAMVNPITDDNAVNVGYLNTQLGAYLPLAGGTMAGALDMGNNALTGLPTPTNATDAVPLSFLNTELDAYIPLAGNPSDPMTGALDVGGQEIENVTAITAADIPFTPINLTNPGGATMMKVQASVGTLENFFLVEVESGANGIVGLFATNSLDAEQSMEISASDLTFAVSQFGFVSFDNHPARELLAIQDGAGARYMTFSPTNAAEGNWIEVFNSETNNPPGIRAEGLDTNVALSLEGKGTGAVEINNSSFQMTQGSDITVPVSEEITPIPDGNYFNIINSSNVIGIASAGWKIGSVIILHPQNGGGNDFLENQAVGPGILPLLTGSGATNVDSNMAITFIRTSTHWLETCRT